MSSWTVDARGSLPHVLLVEDDKVVGSILADLLQAVASVQWVLSGEEAERLLTAEDWDLVIADVELPGMSGLELSRRTREVIPLAATLILTGHSSFDNAVEALRGGADDFMSKPFERPALLATVVELLALGAARKRAGRMVVLAVGAHPDDVEIGCGGILLRHASRGDGVVILTLTGGEQGGEAAERARESARAAELMSARLVHADLSDTSVSEMGSTIATIEQVIADVQPAAVYTHTIHDVHQDHRNVHRATLVAARTVASLYCYQSPSTSVDFRPTRFIGIDDVLARKLEVIRVYESQVKLRRYLEEDVLRATARYWSRFGHSRYAEPLEVVRDTDAQHPVDTATVEEDTVVAGS